MVRTSLFVFSVAAAVAAAASAEITRTRVENFAVEPGSRIEVKIDGGPIKVKVGEPGQVRVELVQTVRTSSEEEGDKRIAATGTMIE
jgi:hypothetical protein